MAVVSTFLPGLRRVRQGKVRDVYEAGDHLLIVATDRLSAFDVVMAEGIPDKGKILNQLSAFWFERLEAVCPNHLITADRDRVRLLVQDDDLVARASLVRRAEPLPIECIVRGYLAGSLLKEVKRDGPNVHGLDLPTGLEEGSRLPEPIFSPSTKATEGHDENISYAQAEEIVGPAVAAQLRDWSIALYVEAERHARSCGLILADTKFEFGQTEDGPIWIDEAFTPDSSRYWEECLWRPGGPQPSYDKQFVRDYLESVGWNKRPPPPALPADIVSRTREKYLEAFRRLVGREPAL